MLSLNAPLPAIAVVERKAVQLSRADHVT